jgi:hypothetical protein
VSEALREAWDDAMLTLIVQRPGLPGEALLAAVISEATDATSRLKERGLVNPPDEDDA